MLPCLSDESYLAASRNFADWEPTKKLKMKQLAMLFMLGFFTNIASAQVENETILSRKVGDDVINVFGELVRRGLVQESDRLLVSQFLVEWPQKGINVNDFTYSQIVDSIVAVKQRFNAAMAKKNNYGMDSVFVRTPNGERFLLGLGELSFEKLVKRSRISLPVKYKGDLDLFIDGSDKSSKAIAKIFADSKIPLIMGNVLYVIRDDSTISKVKIGDLLEISSRIERSNEFAPFNNGLK